jgi:hypothetical protein
MNAIRTTAFFATLFVGFAVSQPGDAMPSAKLYNANAHIGATTSKVDFVPGREVPFGVSYRLDRMNAQTAEAAAQSYYDFDAIITLGTIALAGGGMAALGFSAARRGSARKDAEQAESGAGWRETVMRALEDDLTRYTRTIRRAA